VSRFAGRGGRGEFLIVMMAVVPVLMAGSLLGSAGGIADPLQAVKLVACEGGALLGLGAFLWLRGWRPADLGFKASWQGLLEGGLLAFAALILSSALAFAIQHTWPDLAITTARAEDALVNVGLWHVILVPLLGALLEELFLTGYLMSRLGPVRGLSFAINASVAVRLLCHLDQGAASLVLVLPLGLVLAHWYAATRRLFPVVVAHALLTFLALTPQ
jgi:uncharacterized protein